MICCKTAESNRQMNEGDNRIEIIDQRPNQSHDVSNRSRNESRRKSNRVEEVRPRRRISRREIVQSIEMETLDDIEDHNQDIQG